MKKIFSVILSLSFILSPLTYSTKAHAQGGGYEKMILGMASGVIGGSILLKCKLGGTQPSVLAYLAGGLTYVAAEILTGKGQGKNQA